MLRMNLQLLLLCQVLVKHNVIGSVDTPYPFASLTPLFYKQQYFFHALDIQLITNNNLNGFYRIRSNGVESFPTLGMINVRHCGHNPTPKMHKNPDFTGNRGLFGICKKG